MNITLFKEYTKYAEHQLENNNMDNIQITLHNTSIGLDNINKIEYTQSEVSIAYGINQGYAITDEQINRDITTLLINTKSGIGKGIM